MASKIQVGINSYVDLNDANEYVSLYYMSTSPEYQAWFSDSMTDSDKETALVASAQALNGFKYSGRKAVAGQKLAFPRVNMLLPGIYYTPFVVQSKDASLTSFGGGDNGLEAAKSAQIENAVAQVMFGCLTTKTRARALSGITSKRVDDVSESYSNNSTLIKSAETGIYNPAKIKTLLKSWLDESVFTL